MHPMQQRSTYCNRNRLCSRYAIDAVHEVVKVEQPNNEKHSDRNAQQPHLQLQTEQRQSGKATDPPQSQDSSKQVNQEPPAGRDVMTVIQITVVSR